MLMKLIKMMAIAAAAFVTFSSVKAQDINDDYIRVYAGFNGFDIIDADMAAMNGFMIGGEYNLNVTNHQMPLFLSAGLEYSYNADTNNNLGIKTEKSFHALNIPVNVSYKFGNEKFQVSPFVGQSFRTGLSFKYKVDGKEHSAYDADDANRFQLMLNAGVGLFFKKFSLTYRYMLSEIKISSAKGADNDYSNSLAIGYSF